MFKEFKEFISQGNVIDLAIAVIIGAAFGKIINSLVDDIIMPLIGLLLGKINFENLKIVLPAGNNSPDFVLPYGTFIQNIVNFLIIAFSIFIVVKFINNFRKKNEPAEPQLTTEQRLLLQIKEELVKRK